MPLPDCVLMLAVGDNGQTRTELNLDETDVSRGRSGGSLPVRRVCLGMTNVLRNSIDSHCSLMLASHEVRCALRFYTELDRLGSCQTQFLIVTHHAAGMHSLTGPCVALS